MNKYKLGEGYNKEVKDKSPEWMDEFFKNPEKKAEQVDLSFLETKKQVKKCSKCGKTLADNEVGVCSTCR